MKVLALAAFVLSNLFVLNAYSGRPSAADVAAACKVATSDEEAVSACVKAHPSLLHIKNCGEAGFDVGVKIECFRSKLAPDAIAACSNLTSEIRSKKVCFKSKLTKSEINACSDHANSSKDMINCLSKVQKNVEAEETPPF